MRLTCHACEKRHCEVSTSREVKQGWERICWLMNPEEGPMEADWRQAKDRGD